MKSHRTSNVVGTGRVGLAWVVPTATILASLILGLVLWQCSDGTVEAATPTAGRGRTLYLQAGCGACHGQTALGGSGPALGGHRPEQVVRQIRAPFGAMPMFTENELSDDDVAAIVTFIDELEPVDHDKRWGTVDGVGFDPRDALAAHHWLALLAVRDLDDETAIHQIDHTLEFVAGEHLDAMKNIRTLLEQGERTGAELRLASMSAEYEPDPAFVDMLDLRLAAQAIGAGDLAEAQWHLAAAGDSPLGAVADGARQALESGADLEALDLLSDALGAMTPGPATDGG